MWPAKKIMTWTYNVIEIQITSSNLLLVLLILMCNLLFSDLLILLEVYCFNEGKLSPWLSWRIADISLYNNCSLSCMSAIVLYEIMPAINYTNSNRSRIWQLTLTLLFVKDKTKTSQQSQSMILDFRSYWPNLWKIANCKHKYNEK